MNFFPSAIPSVVRIEPGVFGDSRGFFLEAYRADRMVAAGISAQFIQDNQSGLRKSILRGMHCQIRQAQGKPVRAVSGEIFNAAVDLRRSSPSHGRWVGKVLSADNI